LASPIFEQAFQEDPLFGWNVLKGFGKGILEGLGFAQDEAPPLPQFISARATEEYLAQRPDDIRVRPDGTISSEDFAKLMDAVEMRYAFLKQSIPYGEAFGGSIHELLLPPIDPYDELTAVFFASPPGSLALGTPRAVIAELKAIAGGTLGRAFGRTGLEQALAQQPSAAAIQELRRLGLTATIRTLETGQSVHGIERQQQAIRAQLDTLRALGPSKVKTTVEATLLKTEQRLVRTIAALDDEATRLVSQFETPETLAQFQSVLARTQRLYDGPGKLTLRDRLLRQSADLRMNRVTGLEEAWIDKFAFLNRIEGEALRLRRKVGLGIPFDDRATTWTTMLPSSSLYGSAKTTEVVANMRGILSKVKVVNPKTGVLEPLHTDYVNGFLTAMFEMSISRMAKFEGRVLAGSEGFRTRAALLDYLKTMRAELGEDGWRTVMRAARVVKDAYAEELSLDVAAHLIDEPTAMLLRRSHPWYNPIGYLEEEIAPRIAGRRNTLSVVDNSIRRLSDTGQSLLRERPLEMLERQFTMRQNFRLRNQSSRTMVKVFQFHPEFAGQITERSMVKVVARFKAQTQMLEGKQDTQLIFRRTKRDLDGTISFLENGKLKTYNVPPELERLKHLVNETALGTIENAALMANSVPRAIITSANPVFYGPAFVADTLISMAWSGALPQDIAVSLVRALRNIVKHDPRMTRFMKAGGMPLGMVGKTEGQLIKQAQKRGDLLIRNEHDWKRLFKHPIDTLERVGFALDMAPRDAVFRKALRKGLPETEAALRARRATVDFQRTGTAMRQANALWLYLNASVQGALVPVRQIRDLRVARINSVIATGMSMANYMWNRQFPEYFDLDLETRMGSFVITFPSKERDEHPPDVAGLSGPGPVWRVGDGMAQVHQPAGRGPRRGDVAVRPHDTGAEVF